MLEVVTEFVGRDERLLVWDPEHDLVDLPEELDEDQGLLQPHPLLSQLTQQQSPKSTKLGFKFFFFYLKPV